MESPITQLQWIKVPGFDGSLGLVTREPAYVALTSSIDADIRSIVAPHIVGSIQVEGQEQQILNLNVVEDLIGADKPVVLDGVQLQKPRGQSTAIQGRILAQCRDSKNADAAKVAYAGLSSGELRDHISDILSLFSAPLTPTPDSEEGFTPIAGDIDTCKKRYSINRERGWLMAEEVGGDGTTVCGFRSIPETSLPILANLLEQLQGKQRETIPSRWAPLVDPTTFRPFIPSEHDDEIEKFQHADHAWADEPPPDLGSAQLDLPSQGPANQTKQAPKVVRLRWIKLPGYLQEHREDDENGLVAVTSTLRKEEFNVTDYFKGTVHLAGDGDKATYLRDPRIACGLIAAGYEVILDDVAINRPDNGGKLTYSEMMAQLQRSSDPNLVKLGEIHAYHIEQNHLEENLEAIFTRPFWTAYNQLPGWERASSVDPSKQVHPQLGLLKETTSAGGLSIEKCRAKSKDVSVDEMMTAINALREHRHPHPDYNQPATWLSDVVQGSFKAKQIGKRFDQQNNAKPSYQTRTTTTHADSPEKDSEQFRGVKPLRLR